MLTITTNVQFQPFHKNIKKTPPLSIFLIFEKTVRMDQLFIDTTFSDLCYIQNSKENSISNFIVHCTFYDSNFCLLFGGIDCERIIL